MRASGDATTTTFALPPRRRRRTMVTECRSFVTSDRHPMMVHNPFRLSTTTAARHCALACVMLFGMMQSCEAFIIPQPQYFFTISSSTANAPERCSALHAIPPPRKSRPTSTQADRRSALHAMPPPRKSRPTSSRSLSVSSPSVMNVKEEKSKTKSVALKKRKNVSEEFKLELSMMNHDLLTKEEEQELAVLLQRARHLQEKIDFLISEKKSEGLAVAASRDELQDLLVQQRLDTENYFYEDEDDDGDEYSPLPVYGMGSSNSETREYDATMAEYGWHPSSVEAKSALLQRLDQRSRITKATLFLDDTAAADLPQNKGKNSDVITDDSSNCEVSLEDTLGLTEDDIIRDLLLPGGRIEMQSVLLEGARARDTLVRSNLKLVLSICKRWARISSARDTESLVAIYNGGWDRPSLSEAVQEGVIGLSIAVDRFKPEKGLRFSTFAFYWITNSVRQCFQRASTGCLRLPINYYDTRTRFKTLVKEYYETNGQVPAFDVLARDLGMTERRLLLLLRLTRPLLSTDGPKMPGGATKAGKAGNVNRLEDNLLISETLVDNTELNPEDRVELSLLRQSLEHAMAAELAPFERDVLRLRLGLDDGVTRTCREVADECGGRLSTTEVRSTEKRALKKLRSPVALATYKLLAYLDFADVDRETVNIR